MSPTSAVPNAPGRKRHARKAEQPTDWSPGRGRPAPARGPRRRAGSRWRRRRSGRPARSASSGRVSSPSSDEPDRGTWSVEVVQVLAVEEHRLAVEHDPVDAVGATRAGGRRWGRARRGGGELPRGRCAAARRAGLSTMTGAASKALAVATPGTRGRAVTSRARAASGRGSIAHIALDCSPSTKAARAGVTGVTPTSSRPSSMSGKTMTAGRRAPRQRRSAEPLRRQLPVAGALGDLVGRRAQVGEQLVRAGLDRERLGERLDRERVRVEADRLVGDVGEPLRDEGGGQCGLASTGRAMDDDRAPVRRRGAAGVEEQLPATSVDEVESRSATSAQHRASGLLDALRSEAGRWHDLVGSRRSGSRPTPTGCTVSRFGALLPLTQPPLVCTRWRSHVGLSAATGTACAAAAVPSDTCCV